MCFILLNQTGSGFIKLVALKHNSSQKGVFPFWREEKYLYSYMHTGLIIKCYVYAYKFHLLYN